MKQFKLVGSVLALCAVLALGIGSFDAQAGRGPVKQTTQSLVVGQVVHPTSLSYLPGTPSGVKQHQEYNLPAGEFQIQATLDGSTWIDVGAPLDFYAPYTAGFDIPLGDNIGWRIVVLSLDE